MSVWQKIKAWFSPCDTTSEVISQAAYKNAAKAATAVVRPRSTSTSPGAGTHRPTPRLPSRAVKTDPRHTATTTTPPTPTTQGTVGPYVPNNDYLTNPLHPLNPLSAAYYDSSSSSSDSSSSSSYDSSSSCSSNDSSSSSSYDSGSSSSSDSGSSSGGGCD